MRQLDVNSRKCGEIENSNVLQQMKVQMEITLYFSPPLQNNKNKNTHVFVTLYDSGGNDSRFVTSHTEMKSGLHTCSPRAARGLPTKAVGSSVGRSCPLIMQTHYNICPWAAHGQLRLRIFHSSGQWVAP